MHELSIASSIVETVTAEMQSRGLTSIAKIGLRIGALTNVDPEALRFGFETIIVDTPLAGSTLEIESLPVKATCRKCGLILRRTILSSSVPIANQATTKLRKGRSWISRIWRRSRKIATKALYKVHGRKRRFKRLQLHSHRFSYSCTMTDRISIEKKVLSENDRLAGEIRAVLQARKIVALNLVSSPGSGKTSLLEKTIGALSSELSAWR